MTMVSGVEMGQIWIQNRSTPPSDLAYKKSKVIEE